MFIELIKKRHIIIILISKLEHLEETERQIMQWGVY